MKTYAIFGKTCPLIGDGFEFRTTIKAKSLAEATRLMDALLKEALTVDYEFSVEIWA